MSSRYAQLRADLVDETDELIGLLTGRPEDVWAAPTPAVGWSVQDQVNHLLHFDRATCLALRDPDGFTRWATALTDGGDDFCDRLVAESRDGTPREALTSFREARAELFATLAGVDGRERMPWFGVTMSAASAVTARIMETWAHGQDVYDALGEPRRPTARVRHICHLGVATREFSLALHGQRPAGDVGVHLTAPDGSVWTWGATDAVDRVEGPAVDFALVVTQRRDVADSALRLTGREAERWMSVAQAFAGPPGRGRPRAPGSSP